MGAEESARAPVIKRVVIKRFKRFEEQEFQLKPFNLLIGPNNHGKTTLLQALSAWQLAYSTWRAARKVEPGEIAKNLRGVPIALPNFHSVPLTDFKHLWTGKRTQWFDQRQYANFQKNKAREKHEGKKYQGKYAVEITVHWTSTNQDCASSDHHFGMFFQYENEQSILVKPSPDTVELPADTDAIVLTHIPPFSGLDAQEEYLADGAIRRRIGLSQPGSVVRNLLWRVFKEGDRWSELKTKVERYFGVRLVDPDFNEDIDPHITCQYVDLRGDSDEPFDLVNGGSGFHQLVTILAILYWNKGSHLLLDEPDAHLHAWAQTGVLDCLKDMTRQGRAQIILATHSLAMLDRCKPEEVYSLMTPAPAWLVEDKEKFSVRSGLDNVETSVLTFLQELPFVLYVEGTSDVDILRLLARALGREEMLFDKLPIHVLGGRDPKEAREHFQGVKSFKPKTQGVCVLDPDLNREALLQSVAHHQEAGLEYHVWTRRHVESYLLVPEAIARAVHPDNPLLEAGLPERLRSFLSAAPRGYAFPQQVPDYTTFHLDWMQTFDAKREIFSPSESDNSFILAEERPDITPEHVAQDMHPEELHSDVKRLIDRIYEICAPLSKEWA